MENFSGPCFEGIKNTARKKRSQTSRRPRPDSQSIHENQDYSLSTSTPASDDLSKVSSDENGGCSWRPEFNLNHFIPIVSPSSDVEGKKVHKNIKGSNGRSNGDNVLEKKRCSEGVLAPANWKGTNKVDSGMNRIEEPQDLMRSNLDFDGFGSEKKVKKVKLKVGGVTHTIQANSAANGGSSSSKNCLSSDTFQQRSRPNSQDNITIDRHSIPIIKSGLQGVPWKDFSGSFNLRKESPLMGENCRKSKRIPKKRTMDGLYDEEDEDDDEIRYLEKVKAAKLTGLHSVDDQEPSRKHRSVSKIVGGFGKEKKKAGGSEGLSVSVFEDIDVASDIDLGGRKNKKAKKESIQMSADVQKEIPLTTRQRALQSGKDAPIDFPNGLLAAPSRKQKEKLTDVEQQLKKAEAAQKRKIQVEKAARESEAEAIRKILGQDSTRKKREDKLKKQREELAQERAANALVLASNTIRWVMGPGGTTVTFANNIGLPTIFDSQPRSYPPPRATCAAPDCSNPFKYRDSKSNLPLCSLQCYKAVQPSLATSC